MIESEVTDGNTRPGVCYLELKFIHLYQNTICAYTVYIMYVKPNDSQASPSRVYRAQARWLSWLEHRPIHQKTAGSIPGRTGGNRSMFLSLINVFHSLSLSPPPSSFSKNNKHILRWGFKKKSSKKYKWAIGRMHTKGTHTGREKEDSSGKPL